MGSVRSASTFVLALSILAGCLGPGAPDVTLPSGALRVVGPDGAPIAYASVTAYVGPSILFVTSSNASGGLDLVGFESVLTSLYVRAPGFAAANVSTHGLGAEIRLEKSSALDVGPVLSFLPPVALACPNDPATGAMDVAFLRTCGGFGEPVVEVAGDGTIWASATCCIGRSPPIWTSRDGGKTFEVLRDVGPGLVRDAYGIEGDFAIDDAGNVYFFDMYVAGIYLTSYTKDGEWRWTVPTPFPTDTVDRPWIRASDPDHVFIVFNEGFVQQGSRFYASTDGGKTWGDTYEVPCFLAGFGQGANRNELYITATCSNSPQFWITKDAGKRWDGPEEIPVPEGDFGDQGAYSHEFSTYPVPVADENGTVYVVYTHRVADDSDSVGVVVGRRSADGTWSEAIVLPVLGANDMAWPAASSKGTLAIAWYHADEPEFKKGRAAQNYGGKWSLYTAISTDADAAVPHFQIVVADKGPLATGNLGRQLGDFLQSDFAPDGRFTVVYGKTETAAVPPGDTNVANFFVASDGGLSRPHLAFPNGPKAAPAPA